MSIETPWVSLALELIARDFRAVSRVLAAALIAAVDLVLAILADPVEQDRGGVRMKSGVVDVE